MLRSCFVVALLAVCAYPQTNTWVPAGDLANAREFFTMTALPNGEALVTGGCAGFCNTALAAAETFNPATRTWTPTAPMTRGRYNHAAVLLPNGKVLIIGGQTGLGGGPMADVDLYDPATRSFTPAQPMKRARYYHSAALLAGGRVLVTGGVSCAGSSCSSVASAELYDPATGAWTDTASPMNVARVGHRLVGLPSGKALVVGGCGTTGLPCFPASPSAEVYDPASGAFSQTNPMAVPRNQPGATLLPTGNVLVGGGANAAGTRILQAEQYDPATNSWSPSGTMNVGRQDYPLLTLADGQAFAIGGFTETTEVYNPLAGAWVFAGSMNANRSFQPAVVLTSGMVLTAGGRDASNNNLKSSETYLPAPTPLVTLNPTAIDHGFQLVGTLSDPRIVTLTNNGTAQLLVTGISLDGPAAADFQASGCAGADLAPGQSCTVETRFMPSAIGPRKAELLIADNAPNSPQRVPLNGYGFVESPNSWQPAGNLTRYRLGHTSTLLDDGSVLTAGGTAAPSAAETWNEATRTWTSTGPMRSAHSFHSANRLPDGRILVAGGGTTASELYDQSTGSWSDTGNMLVSRQFHTATLLSNGRVLAAGGCGPACTSTEVFEPLSGRWFASAPMVAARSKHTATRLNDGRIVAIGGGPLAVEIYNPVTREWTGAGALASSRIGHTATLLPGNRILIAGGCGERPCPNAEIYDVATGQVTPANPMPTPRFNHSATTLNNGRVLVTGGIFFCDPEFGFCFDTNRAEVFNPLTGAWRRVANMISPRSLHVTRTLPDGRVLAVGGPNSSTETYQP